MAIHAGPDTVGNGVVLSVDFTNVKNINGTTLTDTYQRPITLTNPGSATLTVTNGYAEFAPATLTGTATFYTISNTYYNSIVSEMTMETVVYPIQNLGADVNYVRPISPRTSETSSPLGFGLGTDRISTEINTTNGWNTAITVSSQITGYNKWYHIVQTTSVSALTMRTYINGVLVKDQPFTGTPNGGNGFLIGRGFYAGNANYAGRVGYLRVYNRAITATEVTQNFSAIRSRFNL